MKKLLLPLLALSGMAFVAKAETVIDSETDYATETSYNFWAPDEVKAMMEIKDGALVITNPTAVDFWQIQYMVSGEFAVTPDVEYTVKAKIKSDVAGDITAVLGTWGTTEAKPLTISGDNEWHEVSTKIPAPVIDVNSFVLFQSGNLVGTIQIAWVEVSHAGTVDIPTTGNEVASFYNGNGKTFGGWGDGATFDTEAMEDGKPCLKFTNETAKNSWEIQACIDAGFNFGQTYYLSFDIKGTPGSAIETSYQYAQDGKYEGKGSMTKFKVTEDWTHVIIYGECVANGNADEHANRLLLNLGTYVGTFYMTNVNLYTTGPTTGVDEVTVAPVNNRTVVYNLLGVKVLDTDDASRLSTLPKGIYIVNGKKVVL